MSYSDKIDQLNLHPLMRDYVVKTTHEYSARVQLYENTYLRVEYELGTRYYNLKQRFTDYYGRILAGKLGNLKSLPLYSFWSLTTKVDGTLTGFHQVKEKVRKGWRDWRSLMAKVGIKSPDYIRVFELTKRFGLHVHVAFFTPMSTEQIKVLAESWDRLHGFVKVYTYQGHEITFEESEMAQVFRLYSPAKEFRTGRTFAWRSEGWLVDNEFMYLDPQWVRVDAKVVSYVYKYMVKVPGMMYRAMLSKERIRTYSCSRQINIWLKTLKDAWLLENKEDLGGVLDTGLYHAGTERGERRKKSVYQKIIARSRYLNVCHVSFGWDDKDFKIELPLHISASGIVSIYCVDRIVADPILATKFNTPYPVGVGFPTRKSH